MFDIFSGDQSPEIAGKLNRQIVCNIKLATLDIILQQAKYDCNARQAMAK